jgi:hypothetical protein
MKICFYRAAAKALLLTLVILLCAVFIPAQTTSGRLLGTISSPDGVLPNATIKARDNTSGKELTATSKEDGSFLFPQLEFGSYTVTVSVPGFKTFVANEVKIDVGRDYSLDPTLEIGSVQESVTVTAGADVVTSTTAQVSNTISPEQILSLPLVDRNPFDLITLQPGTASNSFQGTSINGMRTSATNITRDGINIQDAFIRTNATDFAPGRPSVDDTGEFTLTTSNQEADQGGGGAQIRLVTPRGTKDFHGALFAYNRNSAFGANDFFGNRAGTILETDACAVQGTCTVGEDRIPRPFRNRNQFGGKISGPMPVFNFGEGGPTFLRNKGFFFFAYEGIRDPVSAFRTRTILTPSARSGAFTFNRATAGNPINSGGISCPSGAAGSVCTVPNLLTFAQGLGFANIPSAIDPVVQARVISQLPTTSNFTGGDSLNTAGFALNRKNDTMRNTYTTRIDFDATEKDSFNGVFSWVKNSTLRSDSENNKFTVTPAIDQYSLNKTFVLAYRRIFSSNIVNEVRGGIFTSEVPFERTDAKPDFFFNTAASTLVANLVTFPEATTLSQGRKNRSLNFQDNVDWVVGKHSLRFGGQLQYFQVNSYNEVGTVPSYRLGTGPNTPAFIASNFANQGGSGSLISTTQLTTANNLLALLGGIVNAGTQTFNAETATSGFGPRASFNPYRYSNHSLYISDRWSVTRGLTLTLGLRYEIYPALRLINGLTLEPVITDPDNLAASLLDKNGRFQIVGGNAGRENAYHKTDYNNFAPSVGVAYTPHFKSGIGKFLFGGEGKTVLRGGYSQAYVNDSILTALDGADGSNVGLGSTASNAVVNGSQNLNLRLSGTLPTIAPPVFAGAPTFIQNNNPPISSFIGNISGVDPNLQVPKVEQYSFGIQREFFGNLALEVRYVGSRSNSLLRGVDFNQIDIFNNGILQDFNRALANDKLTGNPFCITAGCQPLQIFREVAGSAGRLGVAPTTATTPTGTLSRTTFLNNLRNGAVADLARLYVSGALNNHPIVTDPNRVPFVNIMPNPASGTADIIVNDASYNYNSLQIEVRRRFAQGLYLQANYTFAKNLTNAVGTSQALFDTYLDNNNKDLDKQRADYDQTHTFNLNGIYQLPFGKGKAFLNRGGAVDKIFGGWEISGLMQWTSGAPISFIDTRGTLNRTGRSGRQTPNTSLSNDELRALSGIFEENGTIYFINPSVINLTTGRASEGFGTTPFAGQAFFNTNPGETGNMARNLIDGPGYFNIDAALLKNIRFGERMRLQIRTEAFNLLNNVNYTFGTAGEQRQAITSSTFGQVTDTTAPRRIQFALRFEF